MVFANKQYSNKEFIRTKEITDLFIKNLISREKFTQRNSVRF